MEIVDYLVENVQFFVVGITPYYYEHGVFLEDQLLNTVFHSYPTCALPI